MRRWLTNEPDPSWEGDYSFAWARVAGFAVVHLGCALCLLTGVSPIALAVAVMLYVLRMFFITAFYHRYFGHRSYRVSRFTQFLMALAGCTTGQRGPLWWASHHRLHHAVSDTPADPHSPVHQSFLYAHCGWFLTRHTFAPRSERVRDWNRYRELRVLERLELIPFVGLAVGCYVLGDWLAAHYPTLGTSGLQMLAWGFFVSTTVLYHATYAINSLAHRVGTRRYDTNDDSRNSWWLAVLTLGEGWHNNHHRFPASVRQGLRWWEIDIAYLGLRLMAFVGLARDLKAPPASALPGEQPASAHVLD